MNNKWLIIWDWDNTLANTRPAVKAGLEDVVRHYGLPALTDADILNVMTSHRGAFWQNNFGENVPHAIDYYVASYMTHTDLVKPFENTIEVLEYVKNLNIPQVILSNKNEVALAEEVQLQGLSDYFSIIQGTNSPLGKPSPEFVAPILKKFNPKKIILIGDGISDMLMAQNINAISIMVHQPDKSLPYVYDCETLSEVKKQLAVLLSESA